MILFHFKKLFSAQKKSQAGFTLVELMVSITIMVIILGVVVVNFNNFDSSVVLTNLAFDIGLSIREAQSYGINVKGQSQTFSYPYGVHFDTTNFTKYTIFVDVNGPDANGKFGDGIWNQDNASEKIKTYTIKPGFKILSICTLSGITEDCVNPTSADITFVRPNPDAKIITSNGASSVSAIEIKIAAIKSPTIIKTITIGTTGQISIK